MAEPFLAEIRIFGFNFAPRGWAFCDGQILSINQNQSLYSLLGTTYGGDGRTTFALPDLRGRTPLHFDTFQLGARAGEERVVLTEQQMPNHQHALMASSTDGDAPVPADFVLARSVNQVYRSPTAPLLPMSTQAVTHTGNSQGHENMQPFLTLNFCIAIQGLFPSRN